MMAIGIWVSSGRSSALYVLFHSVTLPLVLTTSRPLSTNRLEIFTASFSSPPGLSRMSNTIFLAPFSLSFTTALRTSRPASIVKPESWK